VRVLIVTQYFFPEEFRINDVVRSLVDQGIDVHVLTGKPNYPDGEFFPGYERWGCLTHRLLGASIYRIPMLARGRRSALRLIFNYLSFIFSGLLFAPWLLRRQKFDLIFVHGMSPILQTIPALFIARLKKLKVILWVQDLWPQSLDATGYVRNPHLLGLVEQVVRFIYRHTDLLLVQSKGFVAPVLALSPGKQVIYYPNSVESMFCDPTNMHLPIVDSLETGFAIVFAGNVGSAQAIEVIVEAAALLIDYPDIRFVIFGNGSRWEWMREQMQQRGLTNLHLPGRYPVENMPGLMQKASALLVTLADQPIFAATVPNKVQAYLAAGRPILACLNGEGSQLVAEAGAGLTIKAEDAHGLANAVLRMYQMPVEEREALGANGRRYFKEHFDHDRLMEQLIEHFRTLIKVEKVN
jgi:glycosyltransferase involved in cell wall biosynthesis